MYIYVYIHISSCTYTSTLHMRDRFACIPRFIHMCDMTCIYLIRLVHVRGITHAHEDGLEDKTSTNNTHTHTHTSLRALQTSTPAQALFIVWYGALLTGWQKCKDALSCRSFSANEPLILGLFCGNWSIQIRHPMTLRHPVLSLSIWGLFQYMGSFSESEYMGLFFGSRTSSRTHRISTSIQDLFRV